MAIPPIRKTFASLAKVAVAGLFSGWPGAFAQGGKELVDRWASRLGTEERSLYDRLLDEIRESFATLARTEGIEEQRMAVATDTAEEILRTKGLELAAFVELGMNPERAANRVLDRAANELRDLGEPEATLCRRVIQTVYSALLKDPEALQQLDGAFRRAVLTRFDELSSQVATLPGELAQAVRRAAGSALLFNPAKTWHARLFPPSALLRAEFEVVPFYGRRSMLDEIGTWCDDGEPLQVRLYVARGGVGKTRLFIEMCRRLRWGGWRAGFLDRAAAGAPPWALDALLEESRPLFLVVDYAETREAELVRLLTSASNVPEGRKIRFVLLARAEADWWGKLRRAGSDIQSILTGPATTGPFVVPPLAGDAGERREMFDRAARAFGEKLNKTLPSPLAPDLKADHFESVLFIHMASLAALEGLQLGGAQELLDFVLDRERRFWAEGLRSADLPGGLDGGVAQAAAVATLVGGASSRGEARELVLRAPLMRGQPESVIDAVAELLHRLYPGDPERWLEGIRPNLLGEHLVGTAMEDDDSLLDAAVGGTTSRGSRVHALTVLTRLAARQPGAERWLSRAFDRHLSELAELAVAVAIETGDPIGRLLARSVAARPDPARAKRLMELVPERTVALRELAVEVTRQRLDALRASPEPKSFETQADIAGHLNNLSNRLSDLGGWREEAHKACEEAVAIRRELVARNPDAFRPDLASSLNNLSNRLSDLGRREEAHKACEEAVAIRRELVARNPDAFRPDLATSLNNLSADLSALGRMEEALEAIQEAVGLRRALAEKNPDAFRPDLAVSLNNLSVHLIGVGRREEAHKACEEAVGLYRALAEKNPDAFRPDLAASLNNLSIHMSALGRREEALEAIQGSVAIRRELAARNPDAFRPDLAMSLGAMHRVLISLGREAEALKTLKEGVELLRPLFLALPPAHARLMAMLVADYGKLSQSLSQAPDEDLLGPIVQMFERLKEGGGK